MPVRALFPTLVYAARLQPLGGIQFNRELLRECRQVRAEDKLGRKWSAKNYPGGYTSYHSLCRMHKRSSTFEALERKLNRHVKIFARALELDLAGRELAMTDCWINSMPRNLAHGLHLHPLSTLSGTYYVRTPKGSASIKFEDPRLDRFMAAPPRKPDCRPERRAWIEIPAEAGKVVLFESWLRHEVPASVHLSHLEKFSYS